MNNLEAISLYRLSREFLSTGSENIPMVKSKYTYEIVPGDPFDTDPLLNVEGPVVPVRIFRDNMWRGDYVTKELRDFPEYPESSPEEIIIKHRMLKMLGVPVYRNMWYDGNRMLVMTDVRKGGIYKVVSKHDPLRVYTSEQLNLARSLFSDIAIRAYAGGSGVFLYHDAYALLAELSAPEDAPSRYKPLILDIGIGTHRMKRSNVMFTQSQVLQEASHAIAQIFPD